MAAKSYGLLDFALVAITVYAMLVETPAGGLLLRAGAWGLGAPVTTRPFGAEFDAGSERPAIPPLELGKVDEGTPALAREIGLSPGLARALAVTLGLRDGEKGERDEGSSRRIAAALLEVGAPPPRAEDDVVTRRQRVLHGVAELKSRLGGDQAAVAALAAGFSHVLFAVERARAAGAATPSAYDELRPFLPPVRRHQADVLVRGTFALSIAFEMRWPVDSSAPVSSRFGARINPLLGTRRFHAGTDLAVPTGTEVEAVADGQVLFAGQDSVSGAFVKLDHGHGLTSVYCHLSRLEVRSGQRVARGDRVGLSGATGRATGPHLHFQLEIGGGPIDPELFRGPAPSALLPAGIRALGLGRRPVLEPGHERGASTKSFEHKPKHATDRGGLSVVAGRSSHELSPRA